jgi:hypothetical protein
MGIVVNGTLAFYIAGFVAMLVTYVMPANKDKGCGTSPPLAAPKRRVRARAAYDRKRVEPSCIRCFLTDSAQADGDARRAHNCLHLALVRAGIAAPPARRLASAARLHAKPSC